MSPARFNRSVGRGPMESKLRQLDNSTDRLRSWTAPNPLFSRCAFLKGVEGAANSRTSRTRSSAMLGGPKPLAGAFSFGSVSRCFSRLRRRCLKGFWVRRALQPPQVWWAGGGVRTGGFLGAWLREAWCTRLTNRTTSSRPWVSWAFCKCFWGWRWVLKSLK